MNDAQMRKFRKKTSKASEASSCLNGMRKFDAWLKDAHYQPLAFPKGMAKVEKELDVWGLKIAKLKDCPAKVECTKIWAEVRSHVINWGT